MAETEAIPLKVVNATIPQSGSAREIYSSGHSGREAYKHQLKATQQRKALQKEREQKISALQEDLRKQEQKYTSEVEKYKKQKASYEKEYEKYESEFKKAKLKENKIKEQLTKLDETTENSALSSFPIRDLLKGAGAFKKYAPQEQQIIDRYEKEHQMSITPETKSLLLAGYDLKSKNKTKEFIDNYNKEMARKLLTKEKPPGTISEKGLALDKEKYIKEIEKNRQASLTPEAKRQALGYYTPTRTPIWDYVEAQINKTAPILFPTVGELAKRFEDKPIGIVAKTANLLIEQKASDKTKNTLEKIKKPADLTTKFARGSITEMISPALTFPGKAIEPGITTIKQNIQEKGKKQGAIESAETAMKGADYFTTVGENIGKTVGEDIYALHKTITPEVELSGKKLKIKEPDESLKDWVSRPTPATVGAIGTGIYTEFKEDPATFLGGVTGGILMYSVANKILAKPYTRVMGASRNVGQNLKTKFGVIEPVYVKSTPSGLQAIKPQTSGLTKTGFKTKINNLGYTKKVQEVITKDALGRESLPVIINGRPRMIYLVKSPQEISYSGLNVAKTVKQYTPYLNKDGTKQLKNLLTKLKTAKSSTEIKNISGQIKNIDTKYGKRLPEVYTKQAKKGFGESFIEKEYYVGQFGPLGTAQRNLYQQFRGTGKEKFLKVGKPSNNPIESSLFLSPYEPTTKSLLIRKSRLGISNVSKPPSLFSTGGFNVSNKTLPEAFVTKGTRIQKMPKQLQGLIIKSRTSRPAQIKLGKKFKPFQLEPGKGVQPFGYLPSGESEVIVAPGGVVKSTGQIGKIYVPGASTYVRMYDLSIPTAKDLAKTSKTTTQNILKITNTGNVISSTTRKSVSNNVNKLLGSTVKTINTASKTELPLYSTSRLASEIALAIGTVTKDIQKDNSISYEPISKRNYDEPSISYEAIPKRNYEGQIPKRTYDEPSISYEAIPKRNYEGQIPKRTYDEPSISYEPIPKNTYGEFPVSRWTSELLIKGYSAEYPVFKNSIRKQPFYNKNKIRQKKKVAVKEDVPYETYVREKGKWNKIEIDNKTRNKYAAMALGAKVSDQTVARSWKIKKGRGQTVDIKRKIKPNLNKFYRMSKTQNPKLAGAWIEKSKYAIDSPGEFKGITSKGWEKQRKNKFLKNYLGGKTKSKKAIKIKPPRIKSVI